MIEWVKSKMCRRLRRQERRQTMYINLPENVSYIISKLEDAGFEAYAVGGCIRDTILGKEPDD